ncbi:MAG: prepilin peptidase [Rhodospirillales bacterium]|nr:prepilin peptidase [Rhodospirillales bacterium]
MVGLILYLTGILVACACGVMASISDWKGMKIPNLYPGIIILAFGISFAGASLGGYPEIFAGWSAHLLSAGLVLAGSFILYATIRFGAGDSKLITAYALWLPPSMLILFLFFVSLIGAGLSTFAIIVKKNRPFKNPAEGSWVAKLQEGQSVVPYGIAIAGGAIVAFLSHGYVDPVILECFLQTGCS